MTDATKEKRCCEKCIGFAAGQGLADKKPHVVTYCKNPTCPHCHAPQPTGWKKKILALAAEAGREGDLIVAVQAELTKAREEGMSAGWEEKAKKWYYKGREEGHQEGRQEGIKMERERILAFISRWTPNELTHDQQLVVDSIKAIITNPTDGK